MTINDMLWDSITIQGHLIVTRYDNENDRDVVLYDGDAEDVANSYDDDDEDSFLDEEINYIYPHMKEPDIIHIELCY